MRRREVVLAIGLSAVSGLLAALQVNGWMASQYRHLQELADKPSGPVIEMQKVLLAKDNIPFGTQVTKDNTIESEWPASNLPSGSFKSADEFLAENGARLALAPIKANEPIIAERVTGAGQRSGLATLLEAGKKAVTIRVNDVVGVGGLVLPGDMVDILITDEVTGAKEGAPSEAYTDVLLQKVRVLAVDQTWNPAHAEPILGRTVTVAATLAEAQIVTLAATVGTLSLVLSGASPTQEELPRLTASNLPGNSGDNSAVATMIPTIAVAPEAKAVAPDLVPAKKDDTAKISVVRAAEATEYSVKRRFPAE
jgi:pilus assembly protein CpaB